MNKPMSPPRWYAPWRQTQARVEDDPADLGTCFGLEVSLSAEAAQAKTQEEATGRRVGWMRRLTSRRRAAA